MQEFKGIVNNSEGKKKDTAKRMKEIEKAINNGLHQSTNGGVGECRIVPVEPMTGNAPVEASPSWQAEVSGLRPPRLDSGATVTGKTTETLCKENKRQRVRLQELQRRASHWKKAYRRIPRKPRCQYETSAQGKDVPSRAHPRASSRQGPLGICQESMTVQGRSGWTPEEVEAAVKQGPHKLALQQDAMMQLQEEVSEKVEAGQARLCP